MKKMLVPAICISLAVVSCKKETKVEEAWVDNTAEVEAVAENTTVVSADIVQYNKDESEMLDKSEQDAYNQDEEEMIENNPGVTLKNASGETMKLQFNEERNGNKYLTYTKGENALKRVGLLTGHEGKAVYGDDKIAIEVTEDGGKAVFTGTDKKRVEYN